jgi:glutamate synthase domain-containing protein 3
MTTATNGPIEGYLQVPPKITQDGETVTFDSQAVYYKLLNEAIRGALDGGAKKIVINNVNGQRYIGTGVKGKDIEITVNGTPGQDMAMFMDGPRLEVFGNAQDGVGNTMNSGKVIVHGSAGDVLGYGMRGGKVFIQGDVGYRVGIHMKAYEDLRPIMVCGGKARDFFGEYMAGGLLVLLGMNSRIEGPIVGGYLGTGMHGGTIYVRGSVEAWQCGKEVGVFAADEADMADLTPVLKEYCEDLGMDLDEVLAEQFTKLVPVSHRPYGKLYCYL